jgi:hypothetical protein
MSHICSYEPKEVKEILRFAENVDYNAGNPVTIRWLWTRCWMQCSDHLLLIIKLEKSIKIVATINMILSATNSNCLAQH